MKYDQRKVTVTKSDYAGAYIDRTRSVYTIIRPRYYEVIDLNFGTKKRFLVEITDSKTRSADKDDEGAAHACLVFAPIEMPKRVLAVSQLSCSFSRPGRANLRKRAYAMVTFRRPMIRGGRRVVPAKSAKSLPSWFRSTYSKRFAPVFKLNKIEKGKRGNLSEMLCVTFTSWDEVEFVKYYMLSRVFAAYCQYTFIDPDDRRKILKDFAKMPIKLRRILKYMNPSEVSNILHERVEEDEEREIAYLSHIHGVTQSSIRSYLRLRHDEESSWGC